MKYKAIFFDNDGLLVDTESAWFLASKETLSKHNIELTKEWYTENILGKGLRMRDLAREKGMPEEKILELQRERNDYYAELLKKGVKVQDGVVETLEKLKGKFIMGVVTGSYREHFDIIMEVTGLAKYFDFFITGNDVREIKPDPEGYLKAIEKVNLPKEECVVIEDSLRGVLAAKSAGLTCFAVPEPWTRDHDFSIADKVLGSIREFPDHIL